MASDRIREIRQLMSLNARRNNDIYQRTNHLDQSILNQNCALRDELGELIRGRTSKMDMVGLS